MVFKFLLIYALTPFACAFANAVFKVLLMAVKGVHFRKQKSLGRMFEDGELKTDLSFPEQYVLLSAVDEQGNEVEIEGLEDDFDKVDIERYKRKMEAQKDRDNVIVLEI